MALHMVAYEIKMNPITCIIQNRKRGLQLVSFSFSVRQVTYLHFFVIKFILIFAITFDMVYVDSEKFQGIKSKFSPSWQAKADQQ